MAFCDGFEDAPKADRAWPYRSCFASIQTSMIDTGLEKTRHEGHCLDEVQRSNRSTKRDPTTDKVPAQRSQSRVTLAEESKGTGAVERDMGQRAWDP